MDEISYAAGVKYYSTVELFWDFPRFLLCYALFFLIVGILIGYYLKVTVHKIELTKVLHWAADVIGEQKKDIQFVDDWDPDRGELRTYRVLPSVDDAYSGEEYFRECPGKGLARYVKLSWNSDVKFQNRTSLIGT